MDKNIIKETVKKSTLSAKTAYEYKKLVFPEDYLVVMDLKEEKEDLDLEYDVTNLRHMPDIREEDKLTVLGVLMNIKGLEDGAKQYSFELSPENLYYNLNHKVKVKERDVYAAGVGYGEQEFLNEYKALIGFALQNKYSYEDYKQGGNKLMTKGFLQAKVYEATSVQELHTALHDEYLKVEDERKKKKVLISKSIFTGMKIALVTLGVL